MNDEGHGADEDVDVLLGTLMIAGVSLICLGAMAFLWVAGMDVYNTYGLYVGNAYVIAIGIVLFGVAGMIGAALEEDDGGE